MTPIEKIVALLSLMPEVVIAEVLVPELRGTGWSSKPREGYALADDVPVLELGNFLDAGQCMVARETIPDEKEIEREHVLSHPLRAK